MQVHLSSHLRNYTGNRPSVEASGKTVAEVLADLDRQYPGLRFRIIDEQDHIRTHINIYVNTEKVRQIDVPLRASDEIHLLAALSGG